ncbi:hypothetical protein PPL_08894 [Heterostelium album PN500]|uniref:HIT domain-containing protein n=1 Tax=Heterostelium pallidum (strain ATCC 26659 / Pp 5 / PN500) TaxID=670386 RepID=D3BK13_HETP5|nr:hypothetical protein PPL_08894 [Heterostelium album PN500]EFA78243.1 hypothetical protein PPL_08894 [Heterostelium album PN500]|eukprot:XP_020430368.1 hypothetical protein PPL_08894 [Heterostelium album PN500]
MLRVVILEHQYWLGRCIVSPLKHVSPFDLYEQAQQPDSLFLEIGKAIAMMTRVFRSLYGMSYPNIFQLGNLTQDNTGKPTADMKYHHVHYHILPRYEHPVTTHGQTFTDKQWGQPLNIDQSSGY